ncbi:MAG TPA: shikimate kinase [Terriglobales bacterium]|nr:shikimate kinase [Terriglobales bacterium]
MGVLAVFLVGFMGSGKSSVGHELARRLGWNFLDLDAHIESRERTSIAEIFRQKGESGFRMIETAALRNSIASLMKSSVVALGGGAFVQEANRELIRGWPSVFLEGNIDELWHRSSEEDTIRPLRKDRQQFDQLYEERLPFYRLATFTVQTSGKDVGSICQEIERVLRSQRLATAGVPAQSPHCANSDRGGSL